MGSLTKLGPLTTAFEPPRSCFDLHVWTETDHGPVAILGAQYGEICDATKTPNDIDSACYPSSWYSLVKDGGFVFNAFYSPGLACPSGWTVGCSFADSRSPAFAAADHTANYQIESIWSNLKPHETAVVCCPPGFKCDPNWGDCRLNFGVNQIITASSWDSKCREKAITVTAQPSDGVLSNSGITLVVPSGSTLQPIKSAPTTLGVHQKATNGRPTVMEPTTTKMVKGSSNPNSEMDTGTQTETQHREPTSSSNTGDREPASPSNTDRNGDDDVGMALGTKIAIAATIAAIVLGALGVGIFIFRRRGRNRQQRATQGSSNNPTQQHKDDSTAGHAMSDLSKKQPAELTGSTESLLAELPPAVVKGKADEARSSQNHEVTELDSRSYVAELEPTAYSHAVELPG